MRKIFLILTTLAIWTGTSSAQPQALKIGVISSLTGEAAKWGKYQNMGITLAHEELRAQGLDISLIFEDSQTKAVKVISAYNKFVGLDHVDAVISNDFGFVTAPVIPIVAREKRMLVSTGLPLDRYCKEGGGHFFTITSHFKESYAAYEQFFKLHPEVRQIALVIFDDQEWGLTYRGIWEELARKYKVNIVDVLLSTEWTPDYKSWFTKISSKGVQAIFIAHEPVTFHKARRQFNFKGSVVSANNVFEMLVDAPARPELNDVYLADPVISAGFRDKFEQRFKVAPILEAYVGYEALRALVKAFELNEKHPELGMKQVRYRGVAGEIDFTGTSCSGNQAEWGFFQFQGGKVFQVPMKQ